MKAHPITGCAHNFVSYTMRKGIEAFAPTQPCPSPSSQSPYFLLHVIQQAQFRCVNLLKQQLHCVLTARGILYPPPFPLASLMSKGTIQRIGVLRFAILPGTGLSGPSPYRAGLTHLADYPLSPSRHTQERLCRAIVLPQANAGRSGARAKLVKTKSVGSCPIENTLAQVFP